MSKSPRKRGPGRPPDEALAERRRAEILEAAARIFAERGFSQTDLQVVADRLGVGKGTLYRYFPTKRALFLATADHAMDRLGMQVDAALARAVKPLERLSFPICAYLAFFDAHPECIELLIQERAEFRDRQKPTYFVHQDSHMGKWRSLLADLRKRGYLRDIPVRRIIDVLSDLVYGTIFTNLLAGRRKNLEQQAEDILDIVFHGIAAGVRRRGKS